MILINRIVLQSQTAIKIPGIALALFLTCATAGYAQERQLPAAVLGIGGGVQIGFPVYWPFQKDYPVDDMSTDNVKSARAGFSFIFPKVFTDGFGLSLKFGGAYYDMTIESTRDGSTRTPSGERVFGLIQEKVQLRYAAAEMEFLAYAQVGDIARLEIGPYGACGFRPRFSRTVEVISPAQINGNGPWLVEDEVDTEIVVVEGGLDITTSFEIPLAAGLALMPSLSLRAGAVTDSDDDDLWVNANAGVGMTLLFGGTNGTIK